MYWNQPSAKLTGRTLEDAGQAPFWDWLLPEEERLPAKQAWDNLDTPLSAHKGQTHWLARDGSKRLIQWSNTCVRGADGRIEWIAGTGMDVTEREDNARRLRAMLERYTNVWESANDAIFLVDAETGEIVDANPQSERMLGLPKDKIIGMHQSLLHPPEERAGAAEGFRRASEGALPLSTPLDVFVQASDGRRIPVEISSGTFTLDGKRYVQGIFRDLTEHRKADLARRRAEGRSAAILKAIPDQMFALSADGVLVDYHARDPQDLAASPEVFLGRHFGEILPAPVTRLLQAAIEQVRDTGLVQAVEYMTPVLDGAVRHYETRIAPVEEGGFLAIVRNVTDRIEARQALVKQAEDLKQARILAEQANEAKSTFLAAVSHEIRTPLNSILGFSGLLLDSPLTADQRECVETVRFSGQVLLELINDILDVSQVETGYVSIENTQFDLCRSVEDALGLLAVGAEQKGLDLVVQFAPGVPCHMVGDPGRLSQVLLNLVGNAIKFTEQGFVSLEVTRDSAGGGLRFVVTDSGPGIPEDKRRLLFQKFSRLGTRAAQEHGGTGLGLHLSKRFVEMMGGRIGMEGRAGGGSSFWFTVPQSCEPAGRDCTPEPKTRGRQALVADPSPYSRAVLRELCRRSGLDAVEAQSYGEIVRLAAAADRRFAVAFLDLRLGGEGAKDLPGRIRTLPGMAETPLVRIGGWLDREPAASWSGSGAVQSLRRPVFPSSFHGVVASALDLSPKADATPDEPGGSTLSEAGKTASGQVHPRAVGRR